MLASRCEGNKIATRLLQVVRSKEDKRRKFCKVSNCAIGGKYVQTSGGVEVVEIVEISVSCAKMLCDFAVKWLYSL
jgi:hypothetical protein